MNNENQVWWMKEFDEEFPYHATNEFGTTFDADSAAIKAFISRVAQDSYAEGIAIYKRQKDECEKNGSCFTSIKQTICDPCIYYSSTLAALGSIEEEVKK